MNPNTTGSTWPQYKPPAEPPTETTYRQYKPCSHNADLIRMWSGEALCGGCRRIVKHEPAIEDTE